MKDTIFLGAMFYVLRKVHEKKEIEAFSRSRWRGCGGRGHKCGVDDEFLLKHWDSAAEWGV